MENNYTPGPWVFNGVLVLAADDKVLFSTIRTPDEWTANAKLIAVAPDMLSTLEKVYNLFEAEYEDLSDQGKRVRKEVMEAIKKASQ